MRPGGVSSFEPQAFRILVPSRRAFRTQNNRPPWAAAAEQRKDGPEPMFTSAVFNGSLQFFLEPAKALAEASAWVVDGGHIVVSHVQVSRGPSKRGPAWTLLGLEHAQRWGARRFAEAFGGGGSRCASHLPGVLVEPPGRAIGPRRAKCLGFPPGGWSIWVLRPVS